MTNPTNVVVISDRVAPPDALGAIVYWSIRGETSYASLVERLTGVVPTDDLPSETTPSRALGRAAADASTKQVFCRPQNTDHYIVGVQTRDGKTDRLREIGEFKLMQIRKKNNETETKLLFTFTSTDEEHEGTFNAMRKSVAEKYEHELTVLRPSDIGAYLISYAHQINAVALRPSGGFYFIPRPMKGAWSNLTAAIGELHSFYEVPALTTTEAVHAITDALAGEIEQAIAGVRDELTDPDKPIGPKALDNRALSCKTLLSKVRAYEELLETKMDSMCEKINYLEVAIATAKVTLMGQAV